MKSVKLNVLKMISPDFALGKALTFGRALFNVSTLVMTYPSQRSLRVARLIMQVKPRFTMVTSKNLITLYNLVQRANAHGVPGDIAECGVWNGGSAVMMASAMQDADASAPQRALWLFDSFQGLPPPSERDGAAEQEAYFEGWCKGDERNVERAFHSFGLPLHNVTIVPGWFNDTLHTAKVGQIAVLHIDADWYDSVKVVLDNFYDRVAPGGFVMLDDYGYWSGCDRAVADFFAERGITNVAIKQTDHGGAYFQKPV